MDQNTTEIMWTAKNKARGDMNGQMAAFTMGSGTTTKSMDMYKH
jgi:hypothetical protein